MRYCIDRAEFALHFITGTPEGAFSNDAERMLGKLSAELDYTDTKEIFDGGLHEFLDGFQVKLNRVGQSLQETFFDLRVPSGVMQQEQHQ